MGSIIAFIVAAVVVAVGWEVMKHQAARKKAQANLQIMRNAILPHLRVLTRKKLQLLIPDDYGRYDDSRWMSELRYFVKNVLEPDLYPNILVLDRDDTEFLFLLVDDEVTACYEQNPEEFRNVHVRSEDAPLSGEEFELACAEILKEVGWDVRLTPRSGDQGVDILAHMDGFVVAIQCKHTIQPVGNKAVQEVLAGAQYHEANAAVVVASNVFTPSARNLADRTGVLLLSPDMLSELHECL